MEYVGEKKEAIGWKVDPATNISFKIKVFLLQPFAYSLSAKHIQISKEAAPNTLVSFSMTIPY